LFFVIARFLSVVFVNKNYEKKNNKKHHK
jgi:hypothetical protein